MSSNKEVYDRYRKNRPQDIVNMIFLIFMSTVFALYMDDMYFNITVTRAKTFMTGSIFYLILMITSLILEGFMLKYYLYEIPKPWFGCRVAALPELWMGIFLLGNITAFIMAPDKNSAWTGSSGRYFGLELVIVIALVFVFLAHETDLNGILLITTLGTSLFAYILAILQHFGNDPFGLRENVVDRQKSMFISTFGNINTYGAYLCVSIPVFFGVFIFSKKLWARIASLLGVFAGAMAVIPAKSDNVYLGLGAALLLLFYLAVHEKKLADYLLSVTVFAMGLLAIGILSNKLKGSTGHINGIAKILENTRYMTAFLLLMVLLTAAAFIFRRALPEGFGRFQGKDFLIIFSVILLAAGTVVFVLGIRSGNALFRFDDKWGTYRGYIWRRGFDLFKNGTLVEKIFGHGNETVGALMREHYYDEMIAITNKKYDNCHNEVLQYLVTTGLIGAVGYVGLYISGMIYMIRRAKGDPAVMACIGSATAYFFQGLVNLNQPITSPFYFVVLAAGIGYIRYRNQGFGRFRALAES